MDPVIGGAIIGAGAELVGGAISNRAIRRANNENLRMQEEFAKNGIRWRVEDANAAGIHPLYALGASTMSPSVSVQAETGLGNAIQSMGQDLTRATRAGMDTNELQESIMTEQLNNWKLKNEMLGLEIQRAKQPLSPGINPSGVHDDFLSGQNPLFQNQTVKAEFSSPFDKSRSAGSITDIGFVRTTDGGLAIIPSKDVKERTEDQFIPEMMWAYRNQLRPAFTGVTKPDLREFPVPLGYDWEWNAKKQAFYPVKQPWAGKTPSVHRNMPASGEYTFPNYERW